MKPINEKTRFSVMQDLDDRYVITDLSTGKFIGLKIPGQNLISVSAAISDCLNIYDVQNTINELNEKTQQNRFQEQEYELEM